MIITLLMSFLFAQNPSQAGLACISLEKQNLGCVPSTSHPCFRNRPCDSGSQCYYRKGIDVYWEQLTGPIAWLCQEWDNPDCEPGGDVGSCPGSTCLVYYPPPPCRKKCKLCHPEERSFFSTRKGCIICTRPRCPFEPPCAPPNCPSRFPDDPSFYLPQYPLCQPGDACTQTTAIDPNGVEHQVPVEEVGGGCPEIPPEDPPPPIDPPGGAECPWTVDPFPGLVHESQCPPSYPPPEGWEMPPPPEPTPE